MFILTRWYRTTRTDTFYYFYACHSYREGTKVKRTEKYLCGLSRRRIIGNNYQYRLRKIDPEYKELLEKKLESLREEWSK